MSDTSQGPGWWLASDGKWYPPELWTGTPGTGPSPQAAPSSQPSDAPPTTSAPSAYGYGSAPSYPTGAGAPPYPSGGHGYTPAYGQVTDGRAVKRKTNGLAVASLVCSIVGLFLVTTIIGIVFGFVARSQIRRSNGAQGGDGLALAGIIIGFAWVAFWVFTFIVAAVTTKNTSMVQVLLG